MRDNADIDAVRAYADSQLRGCQRCEDSGLGMLVTPDKERWTLVLDALKALERERAHETQPGSRP